MNEIDYMIDAMAADLIALLMERKGWDMDKACDVLYNTDTFAKLSDSKTGLFYQSPLYVYSYLDNEILTGKLN